MDVARGLGYVWDRRRPAGRRLCIYISFDVVCRSSLSYRAAYFARKLQYIYLKGTTVTGKHIIIAFLIISITSSGCTSMRPVEDDADTLRGKIRNGDAVEAGDDVRIITRDGGSHFLEITSIQEQTIDGYDISNLDTAWSIDEDGNRVVNTYEKAPNVEIPIDDIVYIEKQKISAGKTAAVAGGITAGAVLLFLLFPAIVLAAIW